MSKGILFLLLSFGMMFFSSVSPIFAEEPAGEEQVRYQQDQSFHKEINLKLKDVDQKMRYMQSRLEGFEDKLDRISGRMERIQRIERRLSKIDELERKVDRIDRLEKKIDRIRA